MSSVRQLLIAFLLTTTAFATMAMPVGAQDPLAITDPEVCPPLEGPSPDCQDAVLGVDHFIAHFDFRDHEVAPDSGIVNLIADGDGLITIPVDIYSDLAPDSSLYLKFAMFKDPDPTVTCADEEGGNWEAISNPALCVKTLDTQVLSSGGDGPVVFSFLASELPVRTLIESVGEVNGFDVFVYADPRSSHYFFPKNELIAGEPSPEALRLAEVMEAGLANMAQIATPVFFGGLALEVPPAGILPTADEFVAGFSFPDGIADAGNSLVVALNGDGTGYTVNVDARSGAEYDPYDGTLVLNVETLPTTTLMEEIGEGGDADGRVRLYRSADTSGTDGHFTFTIPVESLDGNLSAVNIFVAAGCGNATCPTSHVFLPKDLLVADGRNAEADLLEGGVQGIRAVTPVLLLPDATTVTEEVDAIVCDGLENDTAADCAAEIAEDVLALDPNPVCEVLETENTTVPECIQEVLAGDEGGEECPEGEISTPLACLPNPTGNLGGEGDCADPNPANPDPLWTTLCTLFNGNLGLPLGDDLADEDGRADYAILTVEDAPPVFVQLDFFYTPEGSTPGYDVAALIEQIFGQQIAVPGVMLLAPTSGEPAAQLTNAYNGEEGHIGLYLPNGDGFGLCIVCIDQTNNRVAILAGPATYQSGATQGMLIPQTLASASVVRAAGLAVDIDRIGANSTEDPADDSIAEQDGTPSFAVVNAPALGGAGGQQVGFPDGRGLDLSYIHLKWPGHRGAIPDVVGAYKYSNLDDDPNPDYVELQCPGQPTNPTNPAAYCRGADGDVANGDWDGDGILNSGDDTDRSPDVELSIAVVAGDGSEAPIKPGLAMECSGTIRELIVQVSYNGGESWSDFDGFTDGNGNNDATPTAVCADRPALDNDAKLVNAQDAPRPVKLRLVATNLQGVNTFSNEVDFTVAANAAPTPATNTFTITCNGLNCEHKITGVTPGGDASPGNAIDWVRVTGFDYSSSNGVQPLTLNREGFTDVYSAFFTYGSPNEIPLTVTVRDVGAAQVSYVQQLLFRSAPSISHNNETDNVDVGNGEVEINARLVDNDAHGGDSDTGITLFYRNAGEADYNEVEMSKLFDCFTPSLGRPDEYALECTLGDDSSNGLDFTATVPASSVLEYYFVGHDPTGQQAMSASAGAPWTYAPAGTPQPPETGEVEPVCEGDNATWDQELPCIPASCTSADPAQATDCALRIICPAEFYGVNPEEPSVSPDAEYLPCVPVIPPNVVVCMLAYDSIPEPIRQVFCDMQVPEVPLPDRVPNPLPWFTGDCNAGQDVLNATVPGQQSGGDDCETLLETSFLDALLANATNVTFYTDLLGSIETPAMFGDESTVRDSEGNLQESDDDAGPNGQADVVESYILSYERTPTSVTVHFYEANGLTPPSGETLRIAANATLSRLLVINADGDWSCVYVQNGALGAPALHVGSGASESEACADPGASTDYTVDGSNGIVVRDAASEEAVVGIENGEGGNPYNATVYLPDGSSDLLGNMLGLTYSDEDGAWVLALPDPTSDECETDPDLGIPDPTTCPDGNQTAPLQDGSLPAVPSVGIPDDCDAEGGPAEENATTCELLAIVGGVELPTIGIPDDCDAEGGPAEGNATFCMILQALESPPEVGIPDDCSNEGGPAAENETACAILGAPEGVLGMLGDVLASLCGNDPDLDAALECPSEATPFTAEADVPESGEVQTDIPISATASGEGSETALTCVWSVETMPEGGDVSFTPNECDSVANFTLEGTYVLTVEVTNATGTSDSESATIVISAGAEPECDPTSAEDACLGEELPPSCEAGQTPDADNLCTPEIPSGVPACDEMTPEEKAGQVWVCLGEPDAANPFSVTGLRVHIGPINWTF